MDVNLHVLGANLTPLELKGRETAACFVNSITTALGHVGDLSDQIKFSLGLNLPCNSNEWFFQEDQFTKQLNILIMTSSLTVYVIFPPSNSFL